MVHYTSKDISPFKLVYNDIRIFGFMNHEGRPWSLIYAAFHCFMITTFGITSVLEVFLGSGNLQDQIEALSGVAIFTMTVKKLSNLLMKEKQIQNLLNRLEQVRLEILKDEDNKFIVTEATNNGRKLLLILEIFVITLPIISFIKSVIYDYLSNFEKKHFFFQVWVPWSLEKVWLHIGTRILVTFFALSAAMVNLIVADIHLTFTFQMSAYLRILQRYLETKGPAGAIIYQHHSVMILLIKDYIEIFSGQMMLETLVSPLMPCGYGFTLTRALRRKEFNQLDTVQKISSCILPSFIVCGGAQAIITQVEKLHESSYMSNWYEQTPKVRKDLIILMTRTAKPTVLNYKCFFTFDHERLADVIRGIYSFFMMVINFDTV